MTHPTTIAALLEREGTSAAKPNPRPLTSLDASCPICFGAGVWGGEHGYACNCRSTADPATLRKMLMLLTVKQMAFLRAFEHTHAHQPVTAAEWDEHLCEFWVEDDDAVYDQDDDLVVVIPATRLWFASSSAHMGPLHDGVKTWIQYNPVGLALRECLMAGADARCRP